MSRSCENCSACCFAMEIESLKKPNHQLCLNQCDSGCAIYQVKPAECSDFDCSWLIGVVRDERHRPDHVGLVVWSAPEGSLPHRMRVVNVNEVFDGARNSEEGKALIYNLLADGWTVLVRSRETAPMLQYQLNMAAPGSEAVFNWLSESGFHFKPLKLPVAKAA